MSKMIMPSNTDFQSYLPTFSKMKLAELESFAEELNTFITSQKEKNKLEKMIEEDFQEYDEVFKALA